MASIEKTGSNIEQIIADFRGEHRIQDWELKYKIIKKPSKGFFGLFANKTAVVRFELPELGERAANFISQMLGKMGIQYENVHSQTKGKTAFLEINGSQDSGLLIGKNGYMLETLQYLVNRIYESNRGLDRIYLDVDGYRQRREAQFLNQFKSTIKKVRETGKPQTLEPLNAGDRRIIHRYVGQDKSLRTLTIGEGSRKRIVIFSSKQKESEVLAQARKQRGQQPQERKHPRKSVARPRQERDSAPKRQRQPRKPHFKRRTGDDK